MSYEKEKRVALEAALSAGKLCEQIRQEMAPEAVEKKDGTPVTVADFASQAVICRVLAEAFPADPVVAEEDAAQLTAPEMADRLERVAHYVRCIVPAATNESVIQWINRGSGVVGPRFWVLDPIDGTKGFLRGDQYAVALALVQEGEVKVGVLACPTLPFEPKSTAQTKGALFVALSGQGATAFPLNGDTPRSIHVAGSEQINALPHVESVESSHCDHPLQVEVAKAVGIQVSPLRVDGQAKYGIVARGEAILYLRFPSPRSPKYLEKIWDHAAGTLIVEEAGGRVTDMRGRPLDFSLGPELIDSKGIIAADATVHKKVLKALKSRM